MAVWEEKECGVSKKEKEMMGTFHGDTEEFSIYGFHSAKGAFRCWVTSTLLCQRSSGWHGARHGTRPSVILLTKHQATDSNGHPGRKGGRGVRKRETGGSGCLVLHQAAMWSKLQKQRSVELRLFEGRPHRTHLKCPV